MPSMPSDPVTTPGFRLRDRKTSASPSKEGILFNLAAEIENWSDIPIFTPGLDMSFFAEINVVSIRSNWGSN